MPKGIYVRTKIVWNKGQKMPDKTKKKISESLMGKRRSVKTDKNHSMQKGEFIYG